MHAPRFLQLSFFATSLALWAAAERLFDSPLARCATVWLLFGAFWLWAGWRSAGEGEMPRFTAARRVFAVALGGIFLVAFWSWGSQVRGLVGQHGLLPVGEQLLAISKQPGAFSHTPTFCWMASGDVSLLVQCWLGAALAVALAAGLSPGACALGCWALYLSLMSVGGPFANFQWDALLLETSLLAAAWLPWSARPDWAEESTAQRLGRWLLWLLFARLMLESGVVKLTWGDARWLDYSALDFHFETQPLPLWTSWYAHQWPGWLHRAMCWVTYWVEIATPILLFAPPRWRTVRHLAACAQIALQVAILSTGNYTYFNWLTIALCLPFFDDTLLRRCWRAARFFAPHNDTPPREEGASLIAVIILAVASLGFTWEGLASAFGGSERQQSRSSPDWWDYTRSFNGYGLFRTMTTSRPEIILEGSADGISWREYEFPYKAGDLFRRPALAAPHQPRLDWQMWFAALHPPSNGYWLERLLLRVLQAEPAVLALLEKNPFPTEPPRFVRLLLYDYHFTRSKDHPAAWWSRELKGVLVPPVEKENFKSQ